MPPAKPTLADLFDAPPPSPWLNPKHPHALRRVPAGQAEAARRAGWATAWETWATKHRWDWVVRLSWAGDAVSARRAARDVARWLKRVRRHFPEAAAITGTEVGPAGGRLHVHALVYLDGERHGLPTLAGLWHLGHLRNIALLGHPSPWPHGLTHIERYRPFRHRGGGRAAAYTTKNLTDVNVYGPMPPAYQPRRRR